MNLGHLWGTADRGLQMELPQSCPSVRETYGRRCQEAVLANVFNQIHAPTQVLALGKSRCTDRRLPFTTEDTHALFSKFSWKAP